jgi:hypothetical protein
MAYAVQFEVDLYAEAHVSMVSVQIRSSGEKFEQALDPDTMENQFVGTVELDQVPRYFGLRIFCGDGENLTLCHDEVVFTESTSLQSLSYVLEPGIGTVYARRQGAEDHLGTITQFTGGILLLAVLGAWAHRRVKYRG